MSESRDADERPGWVSEVEEVIRRIRDVRGVRVTTSGSEITEVHIMATAARPANRIVRDIVTALNVSLELPIDYRRISIVQLAEAGSTMTTPSVLDLRPAAAPALVRPLLDSVTLSLQTGRARADVELRQDNAILRGSASGTLRQGAKLRIVAEATLRAVAQAIDSGVEFELEDVREVESSLGQVALVTVRVIEGRSAHELVGTALDRGDIHQAAAVAALDAVNRVLGTLPPRDHTEYSVD